MCLGFAGHLLAICWYPGAPLAMASVAVLLPAIVTIAVTVKRCLASISIAVYCALGAWVSMTLVYTGKIVAIIVYADAIFIIGVVVQEKLFTTFVYAEATLVYWYTAASHTGNCQALLIWLAARGLTGLGAQICIAGLLWLATAGVRIVCASVVDGFFAGGEGEARAKEVGVISGAPCRGSHCLRLRGMADHAPACSPSQLECQAA